MKDAPPFDSYLKKQLGKRWNSALVDKVVTALNQGEDLLPILQALPAEDRLPELDLRGIDLSGQSIMGPANCGANLSGAHLEWACLKKCHLSHANLAKSNLFEADLSEVVGENINFDSAIISGTDFEAAQLPFANFFNVNAGKANFLNAQLEGANFAQIHAEQSCFRIAQLKQVNFRSALLKNADFRNAHLENTAFENSYLEGADLRGVDMKQGRWLKVKARTALLNPGVEAIHQPAFQIPKLDKIANLLQWLIQHIGNIFKLILLITFIWLVIWIYRRISPPDITTVELIPFETMIDGKLEKEKGTFLTNKLLESREAIFNVLDRIQNESQLLPASKLVESNLYFLTKNLLESDGEFGTEPVFAYHAGEISGQNLMISTLMHYQRFEKYSFPLTDFQVLQFIFDLRRARTDNPVLSGTFNRQENRVKAIVRLEKWDKIEGIWAVDTMLTDDLQAISLLALQIVRDELGDSNPFFKNVSTIGFENYIKGLSYLGDYLERKKYQTSDIAQSRKILGLARSAFENAIKTDYSFAPAFYYLAIVNFENGKYDPTAYTTCIQNNQNAWKLIVQQLSELSMQIHRLKSQSDETQLQIYETLYQQIKDNLANTLTNLANAYGMNARRYSPKADDYDNNLKLAINYNQKALRLDSSKTNIYINLAEIYIRLQQHEIATKNFEKAISKGLRNASIYFRLGTLYAQRDSSLIVRATELMQQALDLEPYNPYYRYSLGELLRRTRQTDLARLEYDMAYKILRQNYADDADAYKFFADNFFQNELYDYAARGYQVVDSLLIDKKIVKPEIQYNLAVSLYRLQNYQKAINYYLIAQRYNRFNSSASYDLACAYAQLDDMENACRWLRTALELDALTLDMVEDDSDLVKLRGEECYKNLQKMEFNVTGN
ncbi:pentapeptide repeat-containing protein [candidate division KSB1 bacterium]|nr:pentapeptide repeat-containing protein [candidate division KSB1 bacterium]